MHVTTASASVFHTRLHSQCSRMEWIRSLNELCDSATYSIIAQHTYAQEIWMRQ